MFQLVSDESTQNLGIERHKKRSYAFETLFLSGALIHDSTEEEYDLSIGPNYPSMMSIATEKKDHGLDETNPRMKSCYSALMATGKYSSLGQLALSLEFDAARLKTLHGIGRYKTLDVAAAAISTLDNWYREVLKRKGANQRFLIEKGNSQFLAEDTNASLMPYGDAIIYARNVQAFAMLRENKDLDYQTMVGKIMPTFLYTLGLKEYNLTHDLSSDGRGEVKFILDKVGFFAFYKPEKVSDAAYFERYSYYNGSYNLGFSGPAKGEIVKKYIFDWLVSAARDNDINLRDNYEFEFDELACDVRRAWIEAAENTNKDNIIDHKIGLSAPANIISIANFRHS